MSFKALFDFITDPTVTEDNIEEYLEKMSEIMKNDSLSELVPEQQIQEEVFKNAFIPKRLTEVMLIILL